MTIPAKFQSDVDALPPVLRALLDAELAAGNEIDEIGHSFPAPPIGAAIKLKKRISTRSPGPGDGLRYRAVNGSLYSSEYTDESRRYFLLEPPLPPPEPIDMDAIRRAHNASSGLPTPQRPEASSVRPAAPKTLVERFKASMAMDYDKWHDGTGYDLELLAEANPREKAEIEKILLQSPADGWRDVEALAALDTPAARQALKTAATKGSLETRLAVLRDAPHVIPEEQRTATILKGIKDAEPFGGLSAILGLIEDHHPAPVIEEMLRQTLRGGTNNGVHYAAMLFWIHGKAAAPFDWDHRPFFLKFSGTTGTERRQAFVELCEKIGVDPTPYLKG